MNTVKKLTCVVCPAGCPIEVTLDENGTVLSVCGNSCPRGKKYAESELTHPVRTLTTTVKIESSTERRLPVKTDRPISKTAMFDAMAIVKTITVHAPVHRGDVICTDFAEPGIQLVACKNIDA